MANNLPLVKFEDGLVRLNGMYRHGFLLAPALVEAIVSQLNTGTMTGPVAEIAKL